MNSVREDGWPSSFYGIWQCVESPNPVCINHVDAATTFGETGRDDVQFLLPTRLLIDGNGLANGRWLVFSPHSWLVEARHRPVAPAARWMQDDPYNPTFVLCCKKDLVLMIVDSPQSGTSRSCRENRQSVKLRLLRASGCEQALFSASLSDLPISSGMPGNGRRLRLSV